MAAEVEEVAWFKKYYFQVTPEIVRNLC